VEDQRTNIAIRPQGHVKIAPFALIDLNEAFAFRVTRRVF